MIDDILETVILGFVVLGYAMYVLMCIACCILLFPLLFPLWCIGAAVALLSEETMHDGSGSLGG